jgi:hypothetical protein
VVKSLALNSAKKLNKQIEVHAMDTEDWKAKVESKSPAAKEVGADPGWMDMVS